MNTPYVFKRCTKCGETLPATTEYFYKAKNGKYGLRGECKKCLIECGKQYRENNKEKIKWVDQDVINSVLQDKILYLNEHCY